MIKQIFNEKKVIETKDISQEFKSLVEMYNPEEIYIFLKKSKENLKVFAISSQNNEDIDIPEVAISLLVKASSRMNE